MSLKDAIFKLKTFFQDYPYAFHLIEILVILVTAWLAHSLLRRYLITILSGFVKRVRPEWAEPMQKYKPLEKLAYLAPFFIIYQSSHLVHESLNLLFQTLGLVGMLWSVVTMIDDSLDTVHAVYASHEVSKHHPVKGFIQIFKIILYVITILVTLAILLNKSPWYFLSGIGALTAVLLLVFKDTLLSLVASIQLAFSDMIHIGDWVSMPQYGADGDVIDIALHTVSIQNWDKTISTIPTYKFITESFKNWKGMSQSGGRRICRSIFLDANSVKFIDESLFKKLKKIQILKSYLEQKEIEIERFNEETGVNPGSPVNGRKQTNLGAFRAYMEQYLRSHPRIRKDMTLLVRQQASSEQGIPIQIYTFTNTTVWASYESIQADIFDHFFAILQEFELKVFQNPTGADFSQVQPSSIPQTA
ncbi:mechanosensitive ion channel [bacterium]|jgi:miniconductance mechanosensitive channel|nr:mechanosensitive ion channel [bacterium]